MPYRGKYVPENIAKYKGDVFGIWYRSLLERQVMVYLDRNSNVLEWSSEEIIIPYSSPVGNKIRRYFPDFYVKVKAVDGSIREWIWEVKPEKETRPPVAKTQKELLTETRAKRRRYTLEVIKYGINKNKWEAAQRYCAARGWKFYVITEKQIATMTKLNGSR